MKKYIVTVCNPVENLANHLNEQAPVAEGRTYSFRSILKITATGYVYCLWALDPLVELRPQDFYNAGLAQTELLKEIKDLLIIINNNQNI